MATIDTTGISDGLVIYAPHVLRIIQALDGTTANTIIIDGDFQQGAGNTTNGSNSFAQGNGTVASGNYSHAEGAATQAANTNSHAEGNSTNASGANSHAEGVSSIADGNGSHAEGWFTEANGTGAHAEGNNSVADGQYSHAEGESTEATANYAHSEGNQTDATATHAHSEGRETTAAGVASHAEGYLSEANGQYSHADGVSAIATGIGARAYGRGVIAFDDYQVAIGTWNTANNTDDIFVVGAGTSAGARADAIGVNSTRAYISSSLYLPSMSVGNYSNVIIIDTGSGQLYFTSSKALDVGVVTGNGANNYLAVWNNTTNITTGSVLAYDSTTKRLGINRTTTSPTGDETVHISGTLAAGEFSKSTGAASIALGTGITASSDSQVVVGKYNSSTTHNFVVGVGASNSNRANGLTVDSTGTIISNSLYLPNLNNTAQSNVLTYVPSTGQLYYTASNGLILTSSFLITASVSSNTITFTKGDGSTFPIIVDTGSGAVGTNYQVQYASASKLAGSNGFVYYYPSNSMHVGSTLYGFTGVQYNLSVGNNNIMSSTHSNAGNNLYVGNSNILNGPVGNSILVGSANQYLGPMDSYSPAGNALMVGSSNTVTSASQVVIMGYNNNVVGPLAQAVVFGANNTMLNGGAGNSTIIGPGNYISSSNTGTAIGNSNYVTGDGGVLSIGIAMGVYNTSSGTYASLAAGYSNKATGVTSVALGNSTVASGDYSFTGGVSTKSSNYASFAFGYLATASAAYADAFGLGSVANAQSQFTIGQYNFTSGSGYPFVVGHGSSDSSRVDAFKVRSITSAPNVASIVLPIQSIGSYPADLGTGVAGEMRPIVFGGVYKLALCTGGTSWVTASFG